MTISQKALEDLNLQTLARYNKRLAEKGPGAYALGWGEKRYQTKRFHDLLHVLVPEDLKGKVLLDIGCGLGDLLGFLRRRKTGLKGYRGIDINDRFLAAAKKRHPFGRFEARDLMLDPYPAPVADTGVILGVLNFRTQDPEAYSRSFIRKAFGAVRSALVVNVISDVHNEDYPRESFIHYHKPHALLKFAQTLTPFCSLIHDYRGVPQHELMLVLRKKPWEAAAR